MRRCLLEKDFTLVLTPDTLVGILNLGTCTSGTHSHLASFPSHVIRPGVVLQGHARAGAGAVQVISNVSLVERPQL